MKRTALARLSGISCVAVALASVATAGIAAPVAADEVGGGEPLAALDSVAPEVVESAVALTPGPEGAAAETATGHVNVPADSDDPVQLSSNGVDVQIHLPVSDASLVSHDEGAAIYSERNGVSTIVSAQEDASVVIATTLESASAPSRFDYEYPGLTLEATGDGDVIGYDAAGEIAVFVGIPWAYDANGTAVPTRYEVDGSTLTQIVEHTDATFSYPIVADPTNYGGNDLYTKIVKDADSRGTIIRVYPAAVNFSHLSNTAIWRKYQALTPGAYETTTMYDQLICHVRNIGRLKMPWNLEPWRPVVGYNAVVVAGCNPQ